MITPNTDFTFIQVKSDNLRTLAWQNGRVAEVFEMTTQHPVEESTVSATTKREDKVCEDAERLNDLLPTATDEAVKQVFKEAGAKVIYNFIENKCHLTLKDIADKPEDFSAGLERLLGSAAPVIEKMILQNLFGKLELEFVEKEGYRFSDYIKELREGSS
jgi:hypothetical protein